MTTGSHARATVETGLTWLPTTAVGWDLLPAGRLFRAINRRDIRGDEVKLSISRHYGLVRSSTLGGRSTVKSERLNYIVCEPGDLVVNKYQAHAGGFGAAVERGLITPNYTVFRPARPLNSAYFASLFTSPAYRGLFEVESRGVGDGMAPLYNGAFYRTPVVVPSLQEQAAIVRFIDHFDRRVGRLVRAKQKLVKLLEEQRRKTIRRAVTRGVGSSARLDDSGDPWLGVVPAHWQRRRLGTVARVRKERNTGEMGLLSVFLDRGVIPYAEGGGQVHAPSLDLSRYQVVRAGDFVLNNQQAWRGSVGVSSYDGIISPAYIVLEMSDELEPAFANYLLRSSAMVDQFVVASRGVGDIQRQVYWPHLRSVLVPVPPRDEQLAITRYVDEQTVEIRQAAEIIRTEIELVRELRTRLVSDVVTGQLDVRAAAAALPEEIEEDEPLDDDDGALDEDVDDLDGADEEEDK